MSKIPATTTAFLVGGSYEARSACDHDTVWTFEVVARTAQYITIVDDEGKQRHVGVRVWDGVESASPLGTYSMAPVIRADRQVVDRAISIAMGRTFRCEDCGSAWVRPGAALTPGAGDDCMECGGGVLAGTSWIEDGVMA